MALKSFAAMTDEEIALECRIRATGAVREGDFLKALRKRLPEMATLLDPLIEREEQVFRAMFACANGFKPT